MRHAFRSRRGRGGLRLPRWKSISPGRRCDLLVAGVAESAVTAGGKAVYAFMREAAALDARFLACAMGLARHKAAGKTFIPELAGEAGAAAFIARALDPAWRTLVF